MTAIAYIRGHKVVWKHGGWVYLDDETPANDNRCCVKCECPPTKEGYDACLGKLPAPVVSACCGHGVIPPHKTYGVV